MSVYYVRAPASRSVKIGYAENPRARFSKIQSDCSETLTLAAIEPGAKYLEAVRHVEFAEYRIRGEWFRDEGRLYAHIERLPAALAQVRKIAGAGPLGEWIAHNGMTLASFAEKVGTTQATISRVCNGVQFPRRELMLAIVEATNWEVDANALVGISTPSLVQAA